MSKKQQSSSWRERLDKWKQALERVLPGTPDKKDRLRWQPVYQPVRKPRTLP